MKKALSFIISILVLLTISITTICAADDPVSYSLYFYDGKLYTNAEHTNEYSGANWSGSGNTLTLNDGFKFETYRQLALELPANATLVINGKVSIKTAYSTSAVCSGIKTSAATEADDTLTITGTGNLELISPSSNVEAFIDVNNILFKNVNVVTHSVIASRDITIEGGVIKADFLKAGRDISINKETNKGSVLIADDYGDFITESTTARGINATRDILIKNGETFVLSNTSEAIKAGGKLTIDSNANVVASTIKNTCAAISATTYDLKAPDFASTNRNQTDLVSYNPSDNASYNFYCTNAYKINNKYYAAKLTNDHEIQYILNHNGSGYLNNDVVTSFDVNEKFYENVADHFSNYQSGNIDIHLNDHILDLNDNESLKVNCSKFTLDGSGNSIHYFYDADGDKCYETYSANKPNGIENTIKTKGGVITGGNENGYSSGAIRILTNATINNCNFVGNKTNGKGGAISGGYGGTVDLNNVIIAGNTASDNGGAIVIDNGTFNFNSGEIAYNYAGNNGGAVDCSVGSFHMYSGSLHNNYAEKNGGAIYNDQQSVSFHMHGGIIEKNYAKGYGGGVYDGRSDISFDGVCVVKNNTAGHEDDKNIVENVFTTGTFTIGLSDSPTVLNEGSYIGITKSSGYGVFTNGTYETSSAKYFVSDSPLYLVAITTDNNVELIKNYHVSIVDNEVTSITLDGFDKDTAIKIMNNDYSHSYDENDRVAYQTSGTKYKVLVYISWSWQEDTNTYSLSNLDYVLGTVNKEDYYLICEEEGDVSLDTSGNGYKEFNKGKTTSCTLHIKGFSLGSYEPDNIIVRYGNKSLNRGTDWTATNGSIKIVFDNSFVSTLPVGTNNIYVDAYKNGSIYTFNFNIKINDTSSGKSSKSYKVVNTGVN